MARDDSKAVAHRLTYILHVCPVCGGAMEGVQRIDEHIVASCADCRLALSIPGSLWDKAREERARQRQDKLERVKWFDEDP